jgi:hypothetical protein
MATIEEVQKRRADRAAKLETDRAAQELTDLEAIDKLEAESGESLHTMSANRFAPGVPYKVAFRAPTAAEYKRYVDQVARAGKSSTEQVKARDMLAASCLVYPPDGDARKATLEAFPGLLVSVSIEAAKVAELRAEDEGKG